MAPASEPPIHATARPLHLAAHPTSSLRNVHEDVLPPIPLSSLLPPLSAPGPRLRRLPRPLSCPSFRVQRSRSSTGWPPSPTCVLSQTQTQTCASSPTSRRTSLRVCRFPSSRPRPSTPTPTRRLSHSTPTLFASASASTCSSAHSSASTRRHRSPQQRPAHPAAARHHQARQEAAPRHRPVAQPQRPPAVRLLPLQLRGRRRRRVVSRLLARQAGPVQLLLVLPSAPFRAQVLLLPLRG